MSKQTQKPTIDRTAPEAEIASSLPQAGADVPMPTIENSPPCVFRPTGSIGAVDCVEITLMYLLQLTGSAVTIEKGALRGLALSAERVEQLSDSARRFMTPLGQH